MNVRQNLHMANAHADEEHKTKRRKLLLSEFQAGVWTHEEYRTEVCKLDEPILPLLDLQAFIHVTVQLGES